MLFFYFYFGIFYYALYGMIFANSPQRRLLCMIVILLNYLVSFIYLHLEYLAFVLLIVYIGAISVLFLFVIFLVNVLKVENLKRTFFIPIVFYFLCLFLFFYVWVELNDISFNFNLLCTLTKDVFGIDEKFTPFSNVFSANLRFLDDTIFFEVLDIMLNNIELEQLGFIFWISCTIYILLLAVLLVVAIIGCVVVLKELIMSNLTKKFFLKKL